jgi:dihydroorotase
MGDQVSELGAMGGVLIRGGRVLDPSQGLDDLRDVVVEGDRIVAIGVGDGEERERQVVDASGLIVCPGLVDLHVHVYEWATDFSVSPDDAGIGAGVTTAVDMGTAGAWTLPGLAHHIVEPSVTELYSFINITTIGSMQGGRGGPPVFNADFVDPAAIQRMHGLYPDLVKGIKTYVESGAWSKGWQPFLTKAIEAAERTGLPLYIHTGELLQVDEARRPHPDEPMAAVLASARPGDILGHCYSGQPDGILGSHPAPVPALFDAVERGVLLDVGHGLNFSFETTRRMMDAGLLPNTISSDAHGDLYGVHQVEVCRWSLLGTISKLVALGMPLGECIVRATANPASVLHKEDEIGTLAVGSRADLTLIREIHEPWVFTDGYGAKLRADRRYVPELVLRGGMVHRPARRLLYDVDPERFLEEPSSDAAAARS